MVLLSGAVGFRGTGRPTLASEGAQPLLVDRGYLHALETADEFLNAWRLRDWKSGPDFLTDRLKQQLTDQEIRGFFSGISNPHHHAFEIVGAGRPDEKTVRFHVWLYLYYTGTTPEPMRRPSPLVLEVVRVGPDRWLIDKLPQ